MAAAAGRIDAKTFDAKRVVSGAPSLDIAVFGDIASLETEWRALFAESGATVYQSFDWISAWLAAALPEQRTRPAIVTIREEGRLVMILPLGVERCGLSRIARMLGGDHANIRMPLVATGWIGPADAATTDRFLAAIARAIGGVDLFDFDALPRNSSDAAGFLSRHPAAKPARHDVGWMALDRDFQAVLAAHRGAKKTKKHRWQKNQLAPVGGYRLIRAGSAAEANAFFDAFLAEKAAWFRRMGVENSFDCPGVAPFFRALIARRFDGEAAEGGVIDIDAVEFDGAIHAILGSGEANGRQSGYFLAAMHDDWRRISPGELLIHDVIAAACARGTAKFDLGRGDERYKTSWLDQTEEHVRLLRGVTPLGHACAAVIGRVDRLKRHIRNDERLWRLVQKLRKQRATDNGSSEEQG